MCSSSGWCALNEHASKQPPNYRTSRGSTYSSNPQTQTCTDCCSHDLVIQITKIKSEPQYTNPCVIGNYDCFEIVCVICCAFRFQCPFSFLILTFASFMSRVTRHARELLRVTFHARGKFVENSFLTLMPKSQLFGHRQTH